jgi:hypothetical protein
MVFGESRNKHIDDIVVEEIKQGPSLNIADGIIEAPKTYETEGSERKPRSNALHRPLSHFKSSSFYDKLKFAFKLFGCAMSAFSLLLDFMYL